MLPDTEKKKRGRPPKQVAVPSPEINPDFHIGIFLKSPKVYTGGRYYAQLLSAALSQRCKVTLVTDAQPVHFNENFNAYLNSENHRILIDPQYGESITHNSFDAILSLPMRETLHAAKYAGRFNVPYYPVLFETPDWLASSGLGRQLDAKAPYWVEYRKILPQAAGIITISELAKVAIQDWIEMPEIHVLSPPLNLALINSVLADSQIHKDDRSIAVIGGAVGIPNMNVILRKLIQHSQRPKTMYFIGNAFDSISMNQKRMLKRFAYGKKIQLVMQSLCTDAIKFACLKRSNVLMFPSQFEGFGIPPAEALAFKTKVVAFDLPILRAVYGDKIRYVRMNGIDDYIKAVVEELDVLDVNGTESTIDVEQFDPLRAAQKLLHILSVTKQERAVA